ncbi:DUF1080 domain-containing protein [Pontibacter sp. SGAir0037]|uniref:3-keto-disaccharide hydrolase n=1 Tax=Pontibacter sp. SGAir0037 TaxID=2571030 RepID=UPI0010CD120F|nr:DUF1080 domain-containing protein [Pontibacter sp. SGAir0037]QCR21104.1 DUF1080 domain-containing protein [Pontibacter sp. SGAir0037]
MRKWFGVLQTVIVCSLFIGTVSAFQVKEDWEPLLDKDLAKWDMYLSYRHQKDYKGDMPVGEDGAPLEPIGYNKNIANVFSVTSEGKEPVLKVSGEIYGCIFTKQEYENYHLKLKVRWGDKKWEPRTDKLKDSGVLYHSIGESGVDYWRAWMLSQEFQIMEGHMGDYWTIASSAIDVRAYIPEGNMNTVASAKQPFLPIGAGTGNSGFCLRSEDRESPAGEWTELELICYKDKSLHIVNGQVVMILQNSRHVKDGQTIPLTRGRIQLQSEAAEVYFKDVKIKPINQMPKKYASLF